MTGTASTTLSLPTAFYTSSRAEDRTTERFSPITSRDALSHLEGEGWQLFKAETARTRIQERIPFARHSAQLIHPDLPSVDGLQPLIYLQNANDGTSAFKFMAGLFRFICSNGLVVGNSFASVNVRHTGSSDAITSKLSEASHLMTTLLPQVINQAETMKERQLSVEEIYRLTFTAAALRFPKVNDASQLRGIAQQMDIVRRSEDNSRDLWTTFNRIQESTIRGGIQAGRRRSKGIKSFMRSSSLNQRLWDIAERALVPEQLHQDYVTTLGGFSLN